MSDATLRDPPAATRRGRAIAIAVGAGVFAIGGVAAVLYVAGVIGKAGRPSPIDVEVVAERTTLLGKDTSVPIGPAEVAQLRGRGEVVA